MTITRPSSHVNGAYDIYSDGYSSITVTNNSTIQIPGDFSIAWQQILIADPIVPLTYVIVGKGAFADATKGNFSFGIESVSGYIKVSLGGYTGATGYIVTWTSNSAVLNSSQHKHIVVTWVHSTKTLKIYVNAIEVPTTISGTPSNLASLTDTLDSSDLIWCSASGKTNFAGKLCPNIIIAKKAFTSYEISNLYESVQYTGSYPELGTIVFSSDRTGTYNLHTMNSFGENQNILLASGTADKFPVFTPDGTKIAYLDTTNSYLKKADSGGGNISTLYSSSVVAVSGAIGTTPDSLKVIFCSSQTSASRGLYSLAGANLQSYAASAIGMINTGGQQPASHWHPTNARKFLAAGFVVSSTQVGIKEITLTSDYGNAIGMTAVLLHSILSTDGQGIMDVRYNKQATKVLFSKRTAAGNKYEVYIMDVSGANLIQLTSGSSYDSRACCFNPGYLSTFTVSDGNAVVSSQLFTFLVDLYVVRYDVTGGSAPTGLTNGNTYYIRKGTGTTLLLYPTLTDATNQTNVITIGNLDSGTHTLINISGQKILYMENSNTKWQLYTMDIDGSNKVCISNNSYNDFSADWKV